MAVINEKQAAGRLRGVPLRAEGVAAVLGWSESGVPVQLADVVDEVGVAVFVGASGEEVDAGVDEDADGRGVEGLFGVGGGIFHCRAYVLGTGMGRSDYMGLVNCVMGVIFV